jgi:hypothetical protein
MADPRDAQWPQDAQHPQDALGAQQAQRAQRAQGAFETPDAPARATYDYAIVRVAPRVEREEFVNAGIILFCRTRDYLEARVELDAARLAALAPDLDVPDVQRHLASIPRVCAGGPDSGPIGRLTQSQRFNWLVAPRNTVIQTSPVHAGLCDDPAAALERLMSCLVRQVPSRAAGLEGHSAPAGPSQAPLAGTERDRG